MTKQAKDHDHAAYMREYQAQVRYKRKASKGSGVVAPVSYRAQLARERLAQSENPCVVTVRFNPKHPNEIK